MIKYKCKKKKTLICLNRSLNKTDNSTNKTQRFYVTGLVFMSELEKHPLQQLLAYNV